MDKLNELLNFLFSRKNLPTVVMMLAFIFLLVYSTMNVMLPKYQNWVSLKGEIEDKKSQYETFKSQKDAKDRAAKKSLVKVEDVPVQIFKSPNPELPVESASIDFVTTILKMLERTENTVMDISYKIDTLSEADKATLPSGVSVVQLTMELNGTYTSFMDFITELYGYDYLSTIKAVKVIPLKENKNILDINVVVWLYIVK